MTRSFRNSAEQRSKRTNQMPGLLGRGFSLQA